ncbi:MAG: hypothetical protein HY543_03710 [Deltaproteobacteria bacterium]|nr:hypothetical protein [Deltaproteobacteria bacterium]
MNLNIRGIPDGLYALLKGKAEEESRSLNQQVLWLLRQGLAAAPFDPQLWARMDRRRAQQSRRRKARTDSVALLRKDRGRLT